MVMVPPEEKDTKGVISEETSKHVNALAVGGARLHGCGGLGWPNFPRLHVQ